MQFRVLGAFEVEDDAGQPVEIRGNQARLVLAVLIAAEGRTVRADALLDALWGDDQPSSASGTLQSYLSRLRRALEPDRARGAAPQTLLTEGPGYRLVVDADQVDFRRFERLAAEGRSQLQAGRAEEARAVLDEAETLWRGAPFAEFADEPITSGVASRLLECRLAALEDRMEAELALGQHAALVARLAELVDEHPLRERLRGQHALALYRAGRQAEALRALDDTRRTLLDELGVDPSPPLRALESQILAHDPDLDAPIGVPVPDEPAPEPDAGPVANPTVAAADHDRVGSGRLVGRKHELFQLLAALDEAGAGARMVVIEGEPGIGKTRLCEELTDEAGHRGLPVWWGRAHEGDGAPAFWPWLTILRPLLVGGRDDAEGGSPAPWPRLLQLLAPEGASEVVPGPTRFLLFEEVAALLDRAGEEAPSVVVLDDLQWADPASLELLAFLAGRLTRERVLVVATVRELEVGRSDPVVDALAAIARRPTSRRLRLAGLGVVDTGALLEQATGRPVGDSIAGAIHERAEGNPFYATELARLLADEDRLDDTTAVAVATVPRGVRDVVRQRLSRLPSETVGLLELGAIIGRDPELSLVARSAGVSIDQCFTDIEPALVHRLLVMDPDRPSVVRFAHALVREVILDDVSSLRRARMHLTVADAIAEVGGETDDVAEILAEHLWAAVPVGVGRRAADALDRAADVAIRRLGYEAAEDLLSRAVHLRRAAGTSDEDLALELDAATKVLAVGRALRGYPGMNDAPLLLRAQDIARRLGQEELLFHLRWVEWAGYDTACLHDRGGRVADLLYQAGHDHENPQMRLVAHEAQGIHHWHRGRIAQAAVELDRCAEAAVLARPTAEFFGIEREEWVLGRSFATYIHDLTGDQDDVEQRFEELVAQLSDPLAMTLALTFATAGAYVSGDAERAERAARRSIEADADLSFAFWSATSHAFLGATLIDLGRLEEGLRLLEDGRRRCLAAGIRTNHRMYLAARALGEVAIGRLDEAAATLVEAQAELETYGEYWAETIVLEGQAQLAAARGESDDTVAAILRRGVEVTIEQGSHGMRRRLDRAATELDIPLATIEPAGPA